MQFSRLLLLVPCLALFLVFVGCGASSPDGEKLGSMSERAQQAHQEMDESLGEGKKSGGSASLEKQAKQASGQKTDSKVRKRGKRPSWITSPPVDQQYVYGVGGAEIYGDPASAVNRAQDHARSELLKKLEVTVSGETRTKARRKVKNGKSQVTRSVMSRVQTSVDSTKLTHVDIVDTFVDREEGIGYALARLDRKKAQKDLQDEIERIDARLRKIRAHSGSGSRLERIETLMPAIALLAERREKWNRLDMVTRGNPGFNRPEDLRELERRIADLLDSLVVKLEPRQRGNPQMASILGRELTNRGVRVRESGKGDLILRYSLEKREMERDGLQFVFARGRITMLEQNGDIINEMHKQAKGASQDPGLAADKAIESLAGKLADSLAESLLDSFARAAGSDAY